jgi:hypothetical protein
MKVIAPHDCANEQTLFLAGNPTNEDQLSLLDMSRVNEIGPR